MSKILIVQAKFYEKISEMLLEGAKKEIEKAGYSYEIIDVLGALEIPAAISFASTKKELYAGFIALGCVIRGETTHYDYVCSESARTLNDLAISQKLAIGNGIITVENETQAIARANINQKNKGGFTAKACIEMIKLRKKFGISS